MRPEMSTSDLPLTSSSNLESEKNAEEGQAKWTTIGANQTISAEPLSTKLISSKWLQVLNGSVVFFNTWGLLLSFGSFQAYYQESLLPSETPSNLSWISTFCAFVLLAGGLFTGPLYDAGYLRFLLTSGILVQVLGLMMTSLASEYYQLFLAQGLCIGLGGALLYVPSIAAVASAFDNRTRPKVMGLVASATGLGGVVYPIMFRQLVSQVGFAWAVRAIGFLVLGTYTLSCGAAFSGTKASTAPRQWVDYSAFREMPFVLLLIAAFFSGVGYYLPLLYLPQFTDTAVLGRPNSDLSAYILSIVNGASVLGRLAAGPIAARFGPIETAATALGACSVVLFAWIPVSTITGIIIWAVFWGLISSVIVALPGAILPLLTPSMSLIGTRLGMYWTSVGLGVLVGSPIGGALATQSTLNPVWWHVQVFAALMMGASALLLVYPAVFVRRRNA